MATILIVDHHTGNRKFLLTLLGYTQHRLLEASGSEEAMDTVIAEQPDLVITDVLMPTADGYELVRRIRTAPTVAHTPVIFYTAEYEDSEALALAEAVGVVRFLRKPTDPEKILEAVAAVLGTDAPKPPEPAESFDREHLRLVSDKLVRKVEQLEKEIAVRKRAEAKVQKLNGELEQRVIERTARLESANQALQEEIQARTQLTETLQQNAVHIDDLNHRLRRAMRETHHRVKNSLQVIAALIDMHEESCGPARGMVEPQRIKQHIMGLAAIHDMLTYQHAAGEITYLSVKDALDRLIPMLQALVGDRNIHLSSQDFRLPFAKVTSLTILTNELVNNAMKHGRGDILVSLSAMDGLVQLVVSDHGQGFLKGFDPLQSANVGLVLIESIARLDLGAETDYANMSAGGARVTVKFPFAAIENEVPA